jgi:predicted nucleic acid-binding protein
MYVDSCIIVKLLVQEADSAFFHQALVGQALSSSELAFTEVLSALLIKEREKLISVAERARAWRVFTDRLEAEQIVLHSLNPIVLKKANHVLERCHPTVRLRSLDAIHTATCDLSQDFPFCTTDQRMRDAADVLGIPVFPAEESVKP